jgi:hypothetical protein
MDVTWEISPVSFVAFVSFCGGGPIGQGKTQTRERERERERRRRTRTTTTDVWSSSCSISSLVLERPSHQNRRTSTTTTDEDEGMSEPMNSHGGPLLSLLPPVGKDRDRGQGRSKKAEGRNGEEGGGGYCRGMGIPFSDWKVRRCWREMGCRIMWWRSEDDVIL